MLKRIALFFAALFLLPAQVAAQEAQPDYDLEGFWAFQIDEAVIFIFEIDQRQDGTWRARWTRPQVFGSNGVVFNRMSGATQILAESAEEVGDGVQLSFPDPRPEAVPNVFLFEQTGTHQVTMTYVGTDLEPFPLIRVPWSTRLGPYDNTKLYDRDNAVTETDFVAAEERAAEARAAEAAAEAAAAEATPEAASDAVARPDEAIASPPEDGAEEAQDETDDVAMIGSSVISNTSTAA